ncbi:MAG: FAD-binding oxidoreductase [Anaerolineae bacterium]
MNSRQSTPLPTTFAIPDLRATITGQVITPADADYDAARAVFYGGIDRHPAVIVKVANDADVARVIALARETGLELAVRSGGHSVAGHSVAEGGIVLDLSKMRALHIDTENCTAWAEAGLTAGEYTQAASAHGLATGFGDTASVGLGGITLGGGVGYLVRKYGLTIDDLLAADIVTADGQQLRVDAHHHPDLFWAIRGGGGNFGVVTRFQFRLHPVNSVLGGMLILPATPDVIASFMAEAEAAPDELSAIANVMTAPPMPFLPAEYHGKLIVMAMLVYVGEVETGQRVIAPFRAIAQPIADLIRPMKYPEIYPPDDPNYHPVGASRTLFMDNVDRSVAQTILDRLQASTASMAVTQLRALGGAMARIPIEATAFAHRQRRIMVNVAALYNQPEDKVKHEAWAADFAAVLRQGEAAAYVNFLGEDGAARIREAYPGATWERLTAIKRRYDPTNLFRLNQNIPPANAGQK